MSTLTRAAASSIASGIPSRRWQREATASAFSPPSSNPGAACAARVANSRTDSASSDSSAGAPGTSLGRESDGTRQVTSPGTRSGSRLVASTVRFGAVAEQSLDEVRDRLDQVLAVVEQKQLPAIADVPGERDLRRPVGGQPRVQRLGDRGPDQLGLSERRQLHRPDPVGKVLPAAARRAAAPASSCRSRRLRSG